MEQDKRHIPQSSTQPHNVQTRPADTQDVDKLRENPHNDERTISQSNEVPKPRVDLDTGSTFAEKDEARNEVVNEEEQQVVNPGPNRVENQKKDDEPAVPETPTVPDKPGPEIPETPEAPDAPTNPYEEIGDDPDEAMKKIPKF